MNNVFLWADDYEIALNECDDPRHVLVAIHEVMHRSEEEMDDIDQELFENDFAAMWYYKRLVTAYRQGMARKRKKDEQKKAAEEKARQKKPQYNQYRPYQYKPNYQSGENVQKKVYFKDNRQNYYERERK